MSHLKYEDQLRKPGNRWQKVLYVHQPYPDNYVDETFLASLVTNANFQPYEFWQMVKSTAVIIQQISVLAIFFLIFALVLRDEVSVWTIAGVDVAVLVGVFTWLKSAGPQFNTSTLLPDLPIVLKFAAIFLGVLFALSPILQTLTQSYLNDTIWAQAILLSAMHICFHQYHITSSSSAVSGAISLNAAMFAAVLLASRLPSTSHVFVFVVLAIQLFALFPLFRDFIRVRSENAHYVLTGCLVVITLGLLLLSSTLLAIVYVSGLAFMCIVCPFWLLSVQKYKNEIQGPWDIAEVAQFST